MDKLVGVLGGGQLGRMLVEAANRLNIKVVILDKDQAPAKQISAHDDHITGSFKDPDAIKRLAKTCDVVTVEIEHVDTEVLEQIGGDVSIQPSWRTIRTIQDKYTQKEQLKAHGVAITESIPLDGNSEGELRSIGNALGYPFMLKSRKEAYDGRGNFPIKTEADVADAIKALGDRALYAERWADFKAELAVMVVQTKDGPLAFPTVETVHENSICKLVYAPARNISKEVAKQAQGLAKKAVTALAFGGKGVFGVEMFLLKDDTLFINEVAPRPHNSGHYTIEATPVSQYDAHLRAVLDLPIPEASLQLREPAIMLNILGGSQKYSHLAVAKKALGNPRTAIHLYGKGDGTKGRKMGHVTVTAKSMAEAERMIQPLIDAVDEVAGKPLGPRESEGQKDAPQVAVVMGSDSDMPVLKAGFDILEKFNIPFETRITSAHRTPEWMAGYASGAKARGIKVIVAAAGGAAHLPGMTAAHTVLPVIGVPIKPSIGDGMDSVLSILNMPRGVAVSTVAVNNSTNAALLAAQILAIGDERISAAVEEYRQSARQEVLEKDRRLQEVGPEAYLEGMKE